MKVGNQMRLDFELLSSSLFDFLPSWARFASFMENTGLQGGLEFFIIVSDFYLTCGNIPYKCGHRSNLWRRRNLYGLRSTRKTQKLGGAYAGPFRSFNTLYDRTWRYPWCSNFFFFFFLFCSGIFPTFCLNIAERSKPHSNKLRLLLMMAPVMLAMLAPSTTNPCLPLTGSGCACIPSWVNCVLIRGLRSEKARDKHFSRPSMRMALCWKMSRGIQFFGR